MNQQTAPESFTVNQRVHMQQGGNLRNPKVIAVNGDEVVVRLFQEEATFKKRPSDGKYVGLGQESSAHPDFIAHIPKWTAKDYWDSIHGFFWGWRDS